MPFKDPEKKYPTIKAPDKVVDRALQLIDTTEMSTREIAAKLRDEFGFEAKKSSIWEWVRKLRPNKELAPTRMSLEKKLLHNYHISQTMKTRYKGEKGS